MSRDVKETEPSGVITKFTWVSSRCVGPCQYLRVPSSSNKF